MTGAFVQDRRLHQQIEIALVLQECARVIGQRLGGQARGGIGVALRRIDVHQSAKAAHHRKGAFRPRLVAAQQQRAGKVGVEIGREGLTEREQAARIDELARRIADHRRAALRRAAAAQRHELAQHIAALFAGGRHLRLGRADLQVMIGIRRSDIGKQAEQPRRRAIHGDAFEDMPLRPVEHAVGAGLVGGGARRHVDQPVDRRQEDGQRPRPLSRILQQPDRLAAAALARQFGREARQSVGIAGPGGKRLAQLVERLRIELRLGIDRRLKRTRIAIAGVGQLRHQRVEIGLARRGGCRGIVMAQQRQDQLADMRVALTGIDRNQAAQCRLQLRIVAHPCVELREAVEGAHLARAAARGEAADGIRSGIGTLLRQPQRDEQVDLAWTRRTRVEPRRQIARNRFELVRRPGERDDLSFDIAAPRRQAGIGPQRAPAGQRSIVARFRRKLRKTNPRVVAERAPLRLALA